MTNTRSQPFASTQLLRASLASSVCRRVWNLLRKSSCVSMPPTRFFWPSIPSLMRLFVSDSPTIILVRNELFFSSLIRVLGSLFAQAEVATFDQFPLFQWKNKSLRKAYYGPFYFLYRRPDFSSVIRRQPVQNFAELAQASRGYRTKFLPMLPHIIGVKKPRKTNLSSQINFLIVAKYQEYKNLPLVIEAATLVETTKRASMRIRIVGQCQSKEEERLFEELKSTLRYMKLEDVVFLEKNTPNTEMGELYSWAHFSILPSRWEYAAISLLEGMQFGVVPISSIENGTNCYFEEGRSGFIFDPSEPSDLARVLSNLIDTTGKYEEYSSAARRAITQRASEFEFLRTIGEKFKFSSETSPFGHLQEC